MRDGQCSPLTPVQMTPPVKWKTSLSITLQDNHLSHATCSLLTLFFCIIIISVNKQLIVMTTIESEYDLLRLLESQVLEPLDNLVSMVTNERYTACDLISSTP